MMTMVWVVVLWISALPLLGWDYFQQFYGRSGVCLALHVTPARPPGWQYSVAIFLVSTGGERGWRERGEGERGKGERE